MAACPNGSASLFTAAKVTHLGLLPQGQPERYRRARRMVAQMDAEGFGGCTLYGECQEACPKEISIDTITRMNRDYLRAASPPVAPPSPSRTDPPHPAAVAGSSWSWLAGPLPSQQPISAHVAGAGGRGTHPRADPVPGGGDL